MGDGRELMTRDSWRDQLWQSGLCPKHKLVALAIASYMSAESRAWPSYDSLARRCTMGRSTVVRAVKELREAGWVEVSRTTHAGPSGGTSNVYRPTWPVDLEPPRHCTDNLRRQAAGLRRGPALPTTDQPAPW